MFVDETLVDQSVNAELLAAGPRLPGVLRHPARHAAHPPGRDLPRRPRAAGAGLVAPLRPPTRTGPATVADLAAAEALAIWPKLFRRIVPYLAAGLHRLRRLRRLAAGRPGPPRRRAVPASTGWSRATCTTSCRAPATRSSSPSWPEDFVIGPDPAPRHADRPRRPRRGRRAHPRRAARPGRRGPRPRTGHPDQHHRRSRSTWPAGRWSTAAAAGRGWTADSPARRRRRSPPTRRPARQPRRHARPGRPRPARPSTRWPTRPTRSAPGAPSASADDAGYRRSASAGPSAPARARRLPLPGRARHGALPRPGDPTCAAAWRRTGLSATARTCGG